MTGGVAIADTPGALTPEWLTTALAAGGHLGDARVVAADVAPVGTGQMCDSVRVTLGYDGATGAPPTLVAKLPAADPTSRATALSMRSYEKEVRFYQRIAPGLPVRTPGVFHADIDPATASFVLLLEDLAPAVAGDQLTGCGAEEAALAVAELVNLHAPRWGDESLASLDWLHNDTAEGREMMALMLPSLWDGFQHRYAADLLPHVEQAGDTLFAGMRAWLAPSDSPRTVVHGDYRLDNLLFAPVPRRAWRAWSTGRRARSGRACGTSPTSSAPASSPRSGPGWRRSWSGATTPTWRRRACPATAGTGAGRSTGGARGPGCSWRWGRR